METDYDKLFVDLKRLSGTDDKGAAALLLQALNGQSVPIPQEGKETLLKLVALIYGSEYRRAALNPLVAKAVLRQVAGRGGDLFEQFRARALFVASEKEKGLPEGGSQRSQFHRKPVSRDNPDFKATAYKEYRALRSMARSKGVDVKNHHELMKFIDDELQRHVILHKKMFGPESSGANIVNNNNTNVDVGSNSFDAGDEEMQPQENFEQYQPQSNNLNSIDMITWNDSDDANLKNDMVEGDDIDNNRNTNTISEEHSEIKNENTGQAESRPGSKFRRRSAKGFRSKILNTQYGNVNRAAERRLRLRETKNDSSLNADTHNINDSSKTTNDSNNNNANNDNENDDYDMT